MYAVIITARTTMSPDEIPAKAELAARTMLDVDPCRGLIQKTFIFNGSTIGAFHLFTDRESAEAFLAGPFWTQRQSHPQVSEIDVRHYDVCDEASVLNGTGTSVLKPRPADHDLSPPGSLTTDGKRL